MATILNHIGATLFAFYAPIAIPAAHAVTVITSPPTPITLSAAPTLDVLPALEDGDSYS